MTTALMPGKMDSETLRQKLKLKNLLVKNLFQEKYPHAVEFFRSKGISPTNIREHSARLLSAGALTGALLFSPPQEMKLLPTPREIVDHLNDSAAKTTEDFISDIIKMIIPSTPRPLNRNEEKFLEQIFSEMTGIPVRAALEGEHLNTIYGYIGAEQHLKRYPGDTVAAHGNLINSGIAPGLGAWGYFAPSEEKLSPSLAVTEQWYAVVQTLYLPDWNKRHQFLRDWYKYRKVMIVNTQEGKAVIAAIADSGPAAWTGKQFGGSPEVMNYLGGTKYRKGPVLVFFVDDPDNKIPLGPVKYIKQN